MQLLCRLEGKLPTLNDIIRSRATHWSIYAKQKKDWTARILSEIDKNGSFPSDSGEIELFVLWGLKTNADLDNCTVKFVLDSVVESGMIPDDNSRYVKKITHEVVISKEPFCEVYIGKYLPSDFVSVK